MKNHKTFIRPTIEGIVNRILHKMRIETVDWEHFQEFLKSSDHEIIELKNFLMENLKNHKDNDSELMKNQGDVNE